MIFAPTRRNQLGFLFFVLVAFAICYLVCDNAWKRVAPLPSRANANGLFRLFVFGVLSAERTVFGKSKSIRIVLFIFDTVIVSMLAFGAFKRNFGSCRFGCHNQNSIQKITPLDRRVELVYHTFERLSIFFASFLNFFYIFTKGF